MGKTENTENEVVTKLCAAARALNDFRWEHHGWHFVRGEAQWLSNQLENIVDSFERLLKDMDGVIADERAGEM